MTVVPVINCHFGDDECVESKLKSAENFAEWIHLDVADGAFTFNRSWQNARAWKERNTFLKLEVHLMVEEPEKYAVEWLNAGAKRLIVHLETVNQDSLKRIISLAESKKATVMLAINPETHVQELSKYFGLVKEFQILAVHPGLSGQKFLPVALDKIAWLKNEYPLGHIEVDGGINEETGRRAKEVGADMVAASSFLFKEGDSEKAFKTLLNL